jgi:hypothetical protein
MDKRFFPEKLFEGGERMKSPTCVESRGIVSLKALFFAVVLGAVVGGLGSLLPAQTDGGGSTEDCDWRMFPHDCAQGGVQECDNSRCRSDPECQADCKKVLEDERWCQNPDISNPNGLCCQCDIKRVRCKCTTTDKVVYTGGVASASRKQGWGRCTPVDNQCPLTQPPP